jgi:hypothetical protein
MLSTVNDVQYKDFLKELFEMISVIHNPDSDEALVEVTLQKLDTTLKIAKFFVHAQPVLVTIGYLRTTFVLRNRLQYWQPLLDEAHYRFSIKFKEYKVKSLLRGLSDNI